jgi:hypothetical protein
VPARPFGADAKGGALAWRPVSARSRSRAAEAATLKQIREAACVVCCGDEFDGYCCKRHHPDDSVVCCSRHAPVRMMDISSDCCAGCVDPFHKKKERAPAAPAAGAAPSPRTVLDGPTATLVEQRRPDLDHLVG